MQWLQRMTHGVAADHTTFHHDCLCSDQPALPILEIDQGQNPLIVARRLVASTGTEVSNHVRNLIG